MLLPGVTPNKREEAAVWLQGRIITLSLWENHLHQGPAWAEITEDMCFLNDQTLPRLNDATNTAGRISMCQSLPASHCCHLINVMMVHSGERRGWVGRCPGVDESCGLCRHSWIMSSLRQLQYFLHFGWLLPACSMKGTGPGGLGGRSKIQSSMIWLTSSI